MKFLVDFVNSLGIAGVFALCLFDGSLLWMVPGINDIVVISYVLANGRSWGWGAAGVAAATLGSILGGLGSYRLAAAGRASVILKRFPQGMIGRIESWTTRLGALPVGVAAVLPPPCPYAPFVFIAGLMRVRRDRFTIAILVGRGIRYGIDAWLAILFGKHVITHLHALYWTAFRNTAFVALTALILYAALRIQFARREFGLGLGLRPK